ncbi:MAG: hypothetical protein RL375_2263 [Pseudomonadota bacterium]
MTHPSKHFSLAALMLACAMLTACGGGDAEAPPSASVDAGGPTTPAGPDTTPPSLTIANNVSAPVANGPVTFTFVFSEDVGISFETTDVVVTGGTAGAFNRISGSQATVMVTPTANSSGSINVSVAAGTFTDIAGNANTAAATTSKDFNTVGAGGGGASSGALVSFDEASAPKLTDFGTNGAPPVIAADPAGGANKVLKVFKYQLPAPGSEQWAGVTVSNGANDTVPAIPFTATAKTMTVRVYSPAAGVRVRLKVENAASNGTISCETDALTTTSGAWETLTFNFANPGLSPPVGGGATAPLDLTKTYDKVSIFSDFGIGNGGSGPLPADRVYYYDDLTFVAAGGGGGGGAATAPTTAPSTVIPAGSTVIYSDAAAVAGFDSCPNWGQATVCGGEQTIAANKVLKYSNLNYEGLDWAAAPQNVSTKSILHIDFWSPDVTSVKVSIISAGKENAVTQALTTGVWNGVDIDLAQYTVPDKTAIIQIKLESTTSGTLYVDNIYFASAASASCGTTDPTCAPTTAVPAGSIVIYSDAAAVTGFDSCPNWGQATVCGGEQTIAANKVLKYSNLNYEGLDWAASAQNVSTKGKLHMDFWTPDLTSVKVSIISAGKENAFTQALTTKGWNTVDIPLSNYTVPDKTAIIQIKIESTVPGTLYVDNIYFWDAPASGGGGFTPADMGSRGPQTLVLSTGDSKGIFTAGEGIFAFDYKGGLDAIGNFASYTGGHSDGTPGGGTIGYFNDTAMSTSGQKLDEGGWIVGTSLDAGGTPNFFRYFVLLKPEPAFASSYIGVFANAPNDGTVDVSAFGSIKFRLWGPAEMYQQANLNPVLEMVLSGPKVAGCTTTGSGGTEIAKNLTANLKIGAGSAYKVGLAGFTVKGVCGTDTNATAVASVLSKLARVAFTVPASSFNWVNGNPGATTSYSSGVNLGPIGFTNQ